MNILRLALVFAVSVCFFADKAIGQSNIYIAIETELPVELKWREDFLGVRLQEVPLYDGSKELTLEAEGVRFLDLQSGDAYRRVLIRPGYDYHLTLKDSTIDLTTPDGYHDQFQAAVDILGGYKLSKVGDEALLARLTEIQTRFDSIQAAHPDDAYLALALDYYLARSSITPCIQSNRGAEVVAYFDGMEERLVRTAPFRPEHMSYGLFLQTYYRWKPFIAAFSHSELPGDPSVPARIDEALGQIGRPEVAQLAMVSLAQAKYKGEGSPHADYYLMAVTDIAKNPLHPATGALAEAVLDHMRSLAIGKKVENHRFRTPEGVELSLDSLHQNRYVLLDFWFVGCSPCKRDIPALKSLHTDFANRLTVLAVNPLESIEAVEKYRLKHELPYAAVVPNNPGEVKRAFNVRAYPAYILIDPDGQVALFAASDIGAVRSFLEKKIKLGPALVR